MNYNQLFLETVSTHVLDHMDLKVVMTMKVLEGTLYVIKKDTKLNCRGLV